MLELGFPSLLALCAGALVFFSLAAARLAWQRQRADLADVAWGLGFVLLAWLSFFLGSWTLTGLLVSAMVSVWGLRLSLHLFWQRKDRGEDPRYQAMKRGWKHPGFFTLWLRVFLFQALLLLIVAAPVLWINGHPQAVHWANLGLVLPIWLGGFLFESVADWQLDVFRKQSSSHGQLLTSGLWSLCRHPNYFGELVQWWAIWAISLVYPMGWALVVSPLLLTILIRYVSGVPLLEQAMAKREGFAQWAQQTPCLVPTAAAVGGLYSVAWFGIIELGARQMNWGAVGIALLTAAALYGLLQRESLTVRAQIAPFCLTALALGGLQETILVRSGALIYVGAPALPPLWIVALYPLFTLSSLPGLQRSSIPWWLALPVGGIGAIAAYAAGHLMGAVQIPTWGYIALAACWGLTAAALVRYQKALKTIVARWEDPAFQQQMLTVFFDGRCPLCRHERQLCLRRGSTGPVDLALVQGPEDLERLHAPFSYDQSMEQLKALSAKGEIFSGVEALAALYAKTHWLGMAVLLEAPVWRWCAQVLYKIWARVRPRES
jgi:steroid 5-alpha reductase family enzyme